ncbi:ubiquitin-specific protease 5, partial [Reticulomyxa filosa]
LKMEDFVQFASSSVKLDKLFASFNVVPSPKEEKKKIKELSNSSSKQLGQSWFVVSQKWWDSWCAYVDWEKDMDETSSSTLNNDINANANANTNTNTNTNENKTKTINSALNKKTRPLKIDNSDLLDPYSHIRILRNDIQEGTHFQLLSLSVWTQLHEWYGGGPQIDRVVVSVDKAVRLKLLSVQCKQLLLQRQCTTHVTSSYVYTFYSYIIFFFFWFNATFAY